MCRHCLVNVCPQRNRTCLSNGSYLLNFKQCGNCGKFDTIKIINFTRTEEENDESVSYDHHCSHCDHKIASHSFTFAVSNGYQEYSMDCMLCGFGEDRQSCLPEDPEKMAEYECF